MKIILLKDVAKVGRRFEIKEVSDGYALNFLLPQGAAETATPKALKRVETAKAQMATELKIKEDLLLKNVEDLENVSIEIFGKASDRGHLFAGIHKNEIADEIKKQTRLDVMPDFVNLPHPIKELGEHEVEITAGGKSVKIKVNIKDQEKLAI